MSRHGSMAYLLAYRRRLKWLARSHIATAQWLTCSHIDDGSNGSLARISRWLSGLLARISTTAQMARSLAYRDGSVAHLFAYRRRLKWLARSHIASASASASTSIRSAQSERVNMSLAPLSTHLRVSAHDLRLSFALISKLVAQSQ